jgi:hypothetical protein
MRFASDRLTGAFAEQFRSVILTAMKLLTTCARERSERATYLRFVHATRGQ